MGKFADRKVRTVLDNDKKTCHIVTATIRLNDRTTFDMCRSAMVYPVHVGRTFIPLNKWVPVTDEVRAAVVIDKGPEPELMTSQEHLAYMGMKWLALHAEQSSMLGSASTILSEYFTAKGEAWRTKNAHVIKDIEDGMKELDIDHEFEKAAGGSAVSAFDALVSQLALESTHPLIPESLQQETIDCLHDARNTLASYVAPFHLNHSSCANRISTLLDKLNPKGAKE